MKQTEKVIDYLSTCKEASTSDICNALTITPQRLYRIVNTNRRQFMTGKTIIRIWTTKNGYTVHQTKKDVINETKLRGRLIGGLIINSIPVFKTCKAIAQVEYRQIGFEFGQKVLQLSTKHLLISNLKRRDKK